MQRDLTELPKAHLHLHFTGSMRHQTLVELAAERLVHTGEAALVVRIHARQVGLHVT